MKRCGTSFLALFLAVTFLWTGCAKQTANQMPVDESGSPILVDLAGQFQISKAYFDMALDRVPIIFQGQFQDAAGKREYLERLVVEAVFYLEGKRRKYYRKKEYQHTLDLRLYAGVLDELRKDMESKIPVTEEEVRAEYDRTIKKNREKRTYENFHDAIERGLVQKRLKQQYEDKKEELLKEWKVVFHYDLLARMDPATTPQDQLPKLEDVLADGENYRYTVGQLLKRIDQAPEEAKEKLRQNKNPDKMLDFVVREDVLFTYAVRQGLDKTASYAMRKQIMEVATLSLITRHEVISDDIVATIEEGKKVYEENPALFTRGTSSIPWEEAKDRAMAEATARKKLEAGRTLAKSLMRHRYPTTYYEANIEKYFN